MLYGKALLGFKYKLCTRQSSCFDSMIRLLVRLQLGRVAWQSRCILTSPFLAGWTKQCVDDLASLKEVRLHWPGGQV